MRRAVSVRYVGRADADRIEHDGDPARVRGAAGEQHRLDPVVGERADVEDERRREADHLLDLLGACAMTGSAPSASVAFAVSFMTT